MIWLTWYRMSTHNGQIDRACSSCGAHSNLVIKYGKAICLSCWAFSKGGTAERAEFTDIGAPLVYNRPQMQTNGRQITFYRYEVPVVVPKWTDFSAYDKSTKHTRKQARTRLNALKWFVRRHTAKRRVRKMNEWVVKATTCLGVMIVLASSMLVIGAIVVSAGIVMGITATFAKVKRFVKYHERPGSRTEGC